MNGYSYLCQIGSLPELVVKNSTKRQAQYAYARWYCAEVGLQCSRSVRRNIASRVKAVRFQE